MNVPQGDPYHAYATCSAAAGAIINRLNQLHPGHPLVQEWFYRRSHHLKHQLDKQLGGPNPEDYNLLRVYCNAFSKIIFAGVFHEQNLMLRVILEKGIHEEEWQRFPKERAIFAHCQFVTPSIGSKYAIIDIFQEPSFRDITARLPRYLGVLLHMMTQAYLSMFAMQPCKLFHHGMGTTGHGLPWMRHSQAIEYFCKEVLSLSVSLDRLNSLKKELLANGLHEDQIPFDYLFLVDKVEINKVEIANFLKAHRALKAPANNEKVANNRGVVSSEPVVDNDAVVGNEAVADNADAGRACKRARVN
jgi:hypothetical protein